MASGREKTSPEPLADSATAPCSPMAMPLSLIAVLREGPSAATQTSHSLHIHT